MLSQSNKMLSLHVSKQVTHCAVAAVIILVKSHWYNEMEVPDTVDMVAAFNFLLNL